MEHLCLNIDGNVAMVGPVAVPVTRSIEGDGVIARREGRVKSGPVLTRTGIAVNQDHRPPGPFDYEMQACAVYGYKLGFGLGIVMSNAGCDVGLLESASDAHKSNPSGKGGEAQRAKSKGQSKNHSLLI